MKLPAGEILRFGVVGVTATLVHLGALTIGVERAGVPPVPMNGIAFCLAVGVTYAGQRFWVFRVRDRRPGQVLRFALSVLAGFCGNVALMALATQVFGLPYVWGFAAGLVLVPAATFVLNKFWVFAR